MKRLALMLFGAVACGAQAASGSTAELRHGFVAAPDGVPLAVTECGTPDAPSVLLIHGFGQSYLSFKAQFTPEMCARLHLVAMDLRGHGGSGKPWDPSAYEGRAPWAGDVRAVIASRQLVDPLLVGWSFGGIVAVHYLAEHGVDGVRALALVGSSGGLMPPTSLSGGLSPERIAAVARAAATPDIPGQIESADWFVGVLTAQPLPAATRAELVQASLMLPAYVRAAMRALPVDNSGLEARLSLPVRFLVGAHDATRSVDGLKTLAGRLPDASVLVFEDSGHSPFLEEPERFNRALLELAAAGSVRAADFAPGASAERGKRLFLQCAACHDLVPGDSRKVGPNLYGLIGRAAGSAPGPAASAALKASGIVWTPELLDQWLARPSAVVPGTIMAFAGIAKAEDRASLVAYIQREAAAK